MGMWREHPVRLSFATGVTAGLAVAATLAILAGHFQMSESIWLSLFPPSILGLAAEGASGISVLLTTVFLVGCNAMIYGCVLAGLAGLAIAVRRWFGKNEKPTGALKL